jgi:hypothetical protein
MTWPPPLDFWQWAALAGLGLTFIGVVLAGVGLWTSTRQTNAITGQIGETARLNAAAEERTQTTLAQMDTGLKQVLDRIDERAEQRYRDLKDRLEGEEGTP